MLSVAPTIPPPQHSAKNRRRRIVLTTHGSLGDLHPYLAIALGLQARGHKPVIVTSEYHRRAIETAGVECHALRPDVTVQDEGLPRRLTDPKRGLEPAVSGVNV